MPASLDTLTMKASGRSASWGRKASVPCTTPRRFTSVMRRIWSAAAIPRATACSSKGLNSPAIAALLTTMSAPPWRDRTSSASLHMSSGTETSAGWAQAAPPASMTAAVVRARSSSVMSTATTVAPRRPNSRASARPIPDPAPVMTATRPANDVSGPEGAGDALVASLPHRPPTRSRRRSRRPASGGPSSLLRLRVQSGRPDIQARCRPRPRPTPSRDRSAARWDRPTGGRARPSRSTPSAYCSSPDT